MKLSKIDSDQNYHFLVTNNKRLLIPFNKKLRREKIMAIFLLLGLIIALAASTAIVYFKWQKNLHGEVSYKSRKPMTTVEQTMYRRLTKLLPDRIILAQVGMSRCVSIKGPAFNTLYGERVDFVICNKSMQIIAIVELQDDREITPRRRKIEELKEHAFDMASIQVLRWPANPLPSEAYMAMEFQNSLLYDTRLMVA